MAVLEFDKANRSFSGCKGGFETKVKVWRSGLNLFMERKQLTHGQLSWKERTNKPRKRYVMLASQNKGYGGYLNPEGNVA
jgi:hypothetical protein